MNTATLRVGCAALLALHVLMNVFAFACPFLASAIDGDADLGAVRAWLALGRTVYFALLTLLAIGLAFALRARAAKAAAALLGVAAAVRMGVAVPTVLVDLAEAALLVALLGGAERTSFVRVGRAAAVVFALLSVAAYGISYAGDLSGVALVLALFAGATARAPEARA